MCANQFASQKMHNTVSSLLNATESWYENIDNRKLNISVFLDLKKAFDIVDQNILLSKFALYGIVVVRYNWFATYLTGRGQFCFLNGQSSSKMIKCVVFHRDHAWGYRCLFCM